MRKLFLILFLTMPALLLPGQESEVERLETALDRSIESPAKVDLLTDLAYELYDVDTAKALVYANQAYRLARQLNYQKGLGDSYMRFAQIALQKKNYSKAEDNYRQAIAMRIELGNAVEIAAGYYNFGSFLQDRGDYQRAASSFEESLHWLEEESQRDDYVRSLKGMIYNSLGNAYMNLGEYRSALANIEQSIAIRRDMDNPLSLANSYLNAGICYYQDEVFDAGKADDYLRKSLALFEKAGSPEQAQSLLNLGNLLVHQEKYDSAGVYYDRALATGMLSATDSIRIARNRGSILARLGKPEGALRIYQQCLQSFERLGDEGNRAEIAALYYDMAIVGFQVEGDYKKANLRLDSSRLLADTLRLHELQKRSADSAALISRWETNKKQERIQSFLIIGSILLLSVAAIAALLIRASRRKRQLAEQQAELARQHAQIAEQKADIAQREIDELLTEHELEYNRAKLEGQDRERDRIASDLHDKIGMMLATTKLYFDEPVRMDANENHLESLRRYRKAQESLDEAIQEVRRISHGLASPILTNQGLEAQLKVIARRIQEANGTAMNIQSHGMHNRLDMIVELKVYPIIQGMISNVLKHAGASRIDVQLNHFGDTFNIVVEDNGTGFDPEAVKKNDRRSMGLRSIVTRVKELQGDFHIDSKPGQGSTFMVDIPLPETG